MAKHIPILVVASALLAFILPEEYAQQFSNRYEVFATFVVLILVFDVGNSSEENVKLVKETRYLPIHSWWSPFQFYVKATLGLLCFYLLIEFKGSKEFIWLTVGLGVVLAWWGYSNRRVRQKWMSSAIKLNVQERRGRE